MVDRHKDPVTGLTPQEEQFCQFYVTLNNATHAYKQAYDTSGYTSDHAIESNASKKLANTEVTLRIEALRQPIVDEHEITRDSIVLECLRIVAENGRDRVAALRLASDIAGFNSKTLDINVTKRIDLSNLAPEIQEALVNKFKLKSGVIDVEHERIDE